MPEAERALAELPSGPVSLDELASALVDIGQQHGLIDDVFFDHLVASRPKREHEIRAVQAMWPRPLPTASAASTPARRRT